MRRYVAHCCLAAVVTALSASACSDDNTTAPPADSGPDMTDGGTAQGGDGAGGGQKPSKAGSNSGNGGEDGGGGAAARGGETKGGASTSEGGAGRGGTAGDGGHGGDMESGVGGQPVPGPPDLITSSGGPWPDSLTGTCSTDRSRSICPRSADPFFGQDGTYRINVPSYASTSTTVRDKITNLVWQKLPPAVPLDHAAAVDYCEGLELAEQTDWRLPTRLEYISLLDEGQGAGTALPAAFVPDTSGQYWTASASGVASGSFFVVNDNEGKWNVAVDATSFGVRCVRGSTFAGEQQAIDGVVMDSMTLLSWQADMLPDTARTWSEALAYCEGLTFAGKQDWRLPSIKELATIVDESAAKAPVVAALFGASTASHYWSSTPAPSFGGPALAFTLETSLGISPSLQMVDTARARCVRTTD